MAILGEYNLDLANCIWNILAYSGDMMGIQRTVADYPWNVMKTTMAIERYTMNRHDMTVEVCA